MMKFTIACVFAMIMFFTGLLLGDKMGKRAMINIMELASVSSGLVAHEDGDLLIVERIERSSNVYRVSR